MADKAGYFATLSSILSFRSQLFAFPLRTRPFEAGRSFVGARADRSSFASGNKRSPACLNGALRLGEPPERLQSKLGAKSAAYGPQRSSPMKQGRGSWRTCHLDKCWSTMSSSRISAGPRDLLVASDRCLDRARQDHHCDGLRSIRPSRRLTMRHAL